MKFVVYLTIYKGENLPPFYIGSSTKEKVENGYRGSIKSKRWQKIFDKEIRERPELFDISILSFHKTRKDALIEEEKIQRDLDVVKSSLFFNESIAAPDGFFGRDVSGKNNPFYGKVHTKEVQDKITKKMKETMSDPVWKKKFSETQKRVQNLPHNVERNRHNQKIAQMKPEVIEKKREAMNELWAIPEFKEKHKKACQTEHFRKRQREKTLGKKWIKNEKTKEQIRVNPDEVEKYLNEGWKLGQFPKGIGKKAWFHHPILKKNKTINIKERKKFEDEGWIKGRKLKF